MDKASKRIGVVAPGGPMKSDTAERVTALARRLYPDGRVELMFHPQCFETDGHFAGSDNVRAQAFLDVANDPALDALWFGRGGYGSGRIAELVLPHLAAEARDKLYLGYSDAGAMLGALYGQGFQVAHGPMAQDVVRPGGEAAVARALAWLADRDAAALEPSLQPGVKAAAFNLAILSQIVGTPFQPDLSGHVLMLEEVSEHMYRIDRFLLHVTSNPEIRKVAGLKLGRCREIPPNDPDFGLDEEAVARFWCERSAIPWLGRADIGHDIDNKVVPFGGL